MCAMLHKDYNNFVRPNILQTQSNLSKPKLSCRLSGDEAKRLYLEEVSDIITSESLPTLNPNRHSNPADTTNYSRKRKVNEVDTSNANLFLSVQNNDVDMLKKILDACPEKINEVDQFRWSLLMIACQANAVDVVKELLKRGIDTSVTDNAGNSAKSLVIKNKNVVLADILSAKCFEPRKLNTKTKVKLKEEYLCVTCNNKVFLDKQEHLSSTIHNINASKGKKIPASYVIPESNRGYQIMLKVGWDKQSGLGRDGSGKKYPIKAVQKLDRKGLGMEEKLTEHVREKESSKSINKKKINKDYQRNRRFEVNFRREFY